jgi:hypothetical protein
MPEGAECRSCAFNQAGQENPVVLAFSGGSTRAAAFSCEQRQQAAGVGLQRAASFPLPMGKPSRIEVDEIDRPLA